MFVALRLLTGLLLTASLLLAPATAFALPAGITKITAAEGITEYRLPNGLKVLLLPDPSKPTIIVNMTYLVGSRHENYGETGMAHLLEHLLFKGTPRHPKLNAEFNRRGMRSNGSTNLDRTNYFEIFKASDDNLQWALEMEADRMVHSFIAQKDLRSEMSVVRNEYEHGENSAFGVLLKRIQSVAYDWHNYGKATIGNRSDIENVRLENLQAFYRTYYQPDNAVLTVAGQFDSNKALDWIATRFGSIAKPKRKLPTFWTIEPTQDGERSVTVHREGDVQILALAYKVPADTHLDNDAIAIAAEVLTDKPNGRLHKQLVETGKVATVFNYSVGNAAPGLLLIGAVLKKDDPVEPVRDILLDAVEHFAEPDKEEVERIKRQNANELEQTLNDHEQLGLLMSEVVTHGDWRFLFQARDRQDSITAQQVTQAAQKYFVRDNRTLGLYAPGEAPKRAEVPPTPPIAEVMKGFHPKAASPAGERFEPTPANIDRRTRISKHGGLTLAILPKKTRGDTVEVALNLRWGDADNLREKKWIEMLCNNLVGTSTSQYTRAQLSDEMSHLKMVGSIMHFSTTRENLDAALKLQVHALQDALFTESEFEQARNQMIVSLEARKHDPGNLTTAAMNRHFENWPKDDYRTYADTDEIVVGLRAVTLPQVRDFYRQFAGASHAEMAIVGSANADEVRSLISQHYANWASHMSYAHPDKPFHAVMPVRQIFDTPDKENGNLIAALNFKMIDTDPDYPALFIANYLFGGGAGLNSRLMERVRQQEGLSYGIGSQLSVTVLDDNARFAIQASAAPQNLRKVEALVVEEVQRALTQGFTEDELASAKSGWLQQRQQARTNDAILANGWLSYLRYGRTFQTSQALDDAIAALTLEQVNAAFHKYIDPAQLSFFLAFDHKKANQ